MFRRRTEEKGRTAMGYTQRILLPVVAVAMAMVAVPLHTSAASQVPFRATLTEAVVVEGDCPAPNAQLHCVYVTGSGQATHLGAITESAVVMVDFSTLNPATGCADEIRTSTLTAANGDQITLQGPSVAVRNCLPFASPTWQDLWTVVSGTGRFAGATGSGTNTVSINRTTDPVTSVTTFTGTISY
jgi:hypothetical protein